RREGMARYTIDKTPGRPIERWFACQRISELSELSPPAQPEDTLNSLNSLIRTGISVPSNGTQESTPSPCAHTHTEEDAGQIVCLDCGEQLDVTDACDEVDV